MCTCIISYVESVTCMYVCVIQYSMYAPIIPSLRNIITKRALHVNRDIVHID